MSEPEPVNATETVEDALKRILRELIGEAHVHGWYILDIWWPPSRQVHPRLAEQPVTIALLRCKVCHLPQTIVIDGVWTLEQVTRKASGNDSNN
jgi:hypothetical protein